MIENDNENLLRKKIIESIELWKNNFCVGSMWKKSTNKLKEENDLINVINYCKLLFLKLNDNEKENFLTIEIKEEPELKDIGKLWRGVYFK